ncbi:MAG: hypothetical protein WBW88_04475, partial [Rhodothermales bacterium]
MLTVLCLLVDSRQSGAQSNGTWIDRFGGVEGLNGTVNALAATDSGEVYVGGFFTEAGGNVVSYVAKWTGAAWEGLRGGVEDYVYALELTELGDLYVGGSFVEADGQEARDVARWTGEEWEALVGLHGWVHALAANDTSLFAGGRFGATDQDQAHRLASWNSDGWLDVGGGVRCPCQLEDNAMVNALAMGREGLYVGGYFLEAGDQPASNIAL